MPVVRCQCEGYVDVPWQTIEPRARYWLDVDLDGIRRYLAGTSYRLVGDAVSTQAQTNISHVQAWRTMQEAGVQGQAGYSLTGPMSADQSSWMKPTSLWMARPRCF